MTTVRATKAAKLFLLVSLASCRPGCAREKVEDEAMTLPGAPKFTPELERELEAALASKGPSYAPRTRHKDPSGRARYMNRLIRETSPYLLQHAHNPVNWYPWG